MKRLFCFLIPLALLLCLLPVAVSAAGDEELSLAWSQGTYYDNAVNPNLVSRKYTVIHVSEGDVVTFHYPSANWAIYVYYADAQGSMGYVTSKQGANETFVVQEINGRTPTQLRLTAFHRSGSNVTITDELWKTFDVTVSKTGSASGTNTFTFVTQNVGLWNDGVTAGVTADQVETRTAAWQAVMQMHGMDILVAQEWQTYLDRDQTVDANQAVFGDEYPFTYGEHTSTYDGKAIISRTPLTDISYSTMVSNVGRRYAKAYTVIDGKKVCIIDAHLSFEEDINVNRKEEIVELLNLAQGETYAIIAGDFNVFTADEFEIFEEAGYSLANAGAFGEFNTWPNLGRNPTADVNRVIDNIIVSPGIKIHNAWAEDHRLSDHALLAAELELLDAGEFADNRLMCEHCNQFVEWKPWPATSGGTANAILQSGHYYLPKDLTNLTSAFFIGDKTTAFPDVVLDLRGHALISTSRAFYVRGGGSKLSVVDTVGCGTVSTSYTSTGGGIYVEGGAGFNLYDGAFSNTGAPTSDRKGGVIYLETNASMNLLGGEIYGGKASHGCGIYCGNKNTLNISGGTVYGGTATSAGGAIYMNGGTLNMTGGTVTGGTATNGGGMYLYAATAHLNGGTIYGNSGTYGGNVHTAGNTSGGCLNLGNCNIYGGTASGGGENVFVSSSGAACLTVKDAKFKDAAGKNVTTTAGDMVLYVGGYYTVHDHTMVTDQAVAPDCENTGLTEGKHCTGCDTQTVAQQEIPALGHNYEDVYTEPTFEADGYSTYTCVNCGDSYVVIQEGSKLPYVAGFAEHPASVTVEAGDTACFTVETVGDIVTYRWEYSRNGTTWYNTKMEGASTAALCVPATLARNGYQYRCVVEDALGNVAISEAAALTVTKPAGSVKILEQPGAQTVQAGTDAIFEVAAEGDGLTYQWQYTKNGTAWYSTGMTGYNTATLTVATTLARNGYQYRCIVTDAYGNTVTTEAAALTVTENTLTATDPEDQTVAAAATATFKVTAEGDGLTYQWQYQRADGTKWFHTTMTGCNTDTLIVTATLARNGYKYRCIITDSYGNKTVSEAATLIVE